MSLTRRLKRILRAHLGTVRSDPADFQADPSARTSYHRTSHEQAQSDGSASTSPSSSDVPPDVAKAYRALEVPVGSDRDTVKNAYRDLMKKYHQDRFPDDEEKREIAGTVSKRINKAHDRLIEYLGDAS